MKAQEVERLRLALQAAYRAPFVDDIEDFVWETIFAYSKGLPDLSRQRSKLLFDVVDDETGIGWSAKTLVWDLNKSECEFVIQRADVIKKREALGFPSLTLESSPRELGSAVLAHWRAKVSGDAEQQSVGEARLALLLKGRSDRTKMLPLEDSLQVPSDHDMHWRWTSDERTGLQGFHEGQLRYRWYPNQKQLFEIHPLPAQPQILQLEEWDPFTVGEVIERLRPGAGDTLSGDGSASKVDVVGAPPPDV